MKYISHIAVFLAALFMLSGCGTSTVAKSYRPNDTQLQLRMSDLAFVGETEVEVSYRVYLGCITAVDKVNGVDYDSTQKTVADIGGVRGNLEKACYKVVEQFPDARYYQVVRKTKTTDKLFLGKHVTEKALIRAYDLKK